MFGTSFGNSASSGGAFAPSDITGLKLWLDADAANVNTEAAADFNGSNQYLSSASTELKKGNTSFSFGEWVNASNVVSRGLIGNLQGSGSNRGYGIRLESGVPKIYISTSDFSVGNYAVAVSSTTLSINTWYFIAGVYDADTDLLKIKVNGGAFNTTSWANGSNLSAGDFHLGALDSSTWLLDGKLDLAFFYDKALTEAELNALYNSGNATAYSSLSAAQKTGLVSWWSLSETSGTRYDQHGTNNLTDNNSVGWAAGILSEPVVNDSPVTSWINKGTETRNATQSTAINQPIYKSSGFGTNSKPYLTFDGTNSFLSLGTEYSKIPEHTLFTVHIRGNNLDDSQAIIADGAATGAGSPNITNTSIVHRYRNKQIDTVYGSSSANNYRITRTQQTFESTTDVYISMDSKENAVALNTIKVNGTTYSVNDVTGTGTTIEGTPTATSIGKWGDESYGYFDGDIAEILLYNSVLTASEIESVETYLNAKYAAY